MVGRSCSLPAMAWQRADFPLYSERKMDFESLLQRIPKVDLHCHLVGTLRPATLAQLAQKHGGVALPRPAQHL